MFPWLWLWAPQVHFPWSGDVAQRIEPDMSWFFGAIAPAAGNARIEQKAFRIASYGKQLGLLTEVVLAMTSELEPKGAKARESLDRLRKLAAQIEELKSAQYGELAVAIAEQARELERKRPAEFDRLRELLAADKPSLLARAQPRRSPQRKLIVRKPREGA